MFWKTLRCTSLKTDCPFKVVLRATGKDSLKVKSVVLKHNHASISRTTFLFKFKRQ